MKFVSSYFRNYFLLFLLWLFLDNSCFTIINVNDFFSIGDILGFLFFGSMFISIIQLIIEKIIKYKKEDQNFNKTTDEEILKVVIEEIIKKEGEKSFKELIKIYHPDNINTGNADITRILIEQHNAIKNKE